MSEKLLSRIIRNPRIFGGRPCIRGMNIRVSEVQHLLVEQGLSFEEVLEKMPALEWDDLRAVLLYASLQKH
ncbi:MAG: DUF433 domain-containing protein [Cyanobacteria bacterium SBLK]|nr:DUF433 domain-containing protein [Cyanobacteria bacterium SBLK]